ncbi:MAG: biopolymer transporter ExbB [Gammaproteobacteria bacterium]|nr:MAG: biopolymer transporter ExbB [Gammaproteobacteria bacterium]
MIWRILLLILFAVTLVIPYAKAQTEDIRSVYQKIAQQKASSQALKDKTARVIRLKRENLQATLRKLRQEKLLIENDLASRQETYTNLHSQYQKLEQAERSDQELMTNLIAAVRVSARQLQELTLRSALTAMQPDRPERMDVIVKGKHFPGLDDMQLMADMFFTEIDQVGHVVRPQLEYRDHSGRNSIGDVLLIGPFLAAVDSAEGLELLRYDGSSRSFSAIAAPLPWLLERQLRSYLDGESDSVALDLSAGAALEQLTHRKTMVQRVEEGGFLVWPILLLALAAIIIGIERIIFLRRVRANTDRTMSEVHRLVAKNDWDGCEKLVEERFSPVFNVVRAGLSARNECHEILESVLHEAILKELPRLERALPLLNIMGAVAPLIGLLGTVTGMIGTFEVINIYGTGDPRMMSGGISVALVTTMLGLTVAIPIMLLHTYLGRRVEHVIGDMEEKSVTLANIIHRWRLGGS